MRDDLLSVDDESLPHPVIGDQSNYCSWNGLNDVHEWREDMLLLPDEGDDENRY